METSLVAYNWQEPQLKLFPFQPQTLDEIVFDADNPVGIPQLDLSMQATGLIEPVNVFNSVAKRNYQTGTCIFYSSDRRINSVWANPDIVPNAGFQVAVEPNFSIQYRMPPAVAIYEVFRKRWLARYWQTQGIKIIIDLNVAPNYRKLNLCGVPYGWKIFATRCCREYLWWLDEEYAIAKDVSGGDPIFIVYGGKPGREIARRCARKGWIHVADWTSTISKQRIHQIQSWVEQEKAVVAAEQAKAQAAGAEAD